MAVIDHKATSAESYINRESATLHICPHNADLEVREDTIYESCQRISNGVDESLFRRRLQISPLNGSNKKC